VRSATHEWPDRGPGVTRSSNLQQTPICQQRITQAKHGLASYVRDFKTEAAKRLTNAKFADRGLDNSWASHVRNVFSYLDYVDASWQMKSL